PQAGGLLRHHTGALVLQRQHRRVDRAQGQRLEGQPERRVPDGVGAWKQRRDSLVRVSTRLALVGDLQLRVAYPKIMWRRVSATWLCSLGTSIAVACPFPLDSPEAIFRRSSSLTSRLVSATCRNLCHAASALPSASLIPSRPKRWWKACRQ